MKSGFADAITRNHDAEAILTPETIGVHKGLHFVV